MKHIIIGGVAGGATAAARIRRADENAEIIVFEKGGYISYANCGLPYYIGGSIKERDRLLLQTPSGFGKRFNLEVQVENEVLKINPQQKNIEVKNHKTGEIYTETYDKLLISTGAKAVYPPIKGVDLEGVFTLRNVEDTDRIKSYTKTHHVKQAVVIGGGFIGLEMAENLHELGSKVSVVERLNQVMPPLDFHMAAMVHQHLLQKGVNLHLQTSVKSFEKKGDKIEVLLDDSQVILADLVILSAGVKPNISLAEDADIQIGKTGGIWVNEFLETSQKDVYAVGDVIEYPHPITKEPYLNYLANPANRQARIVADNMVFGNKTTYEGAISTAIAKVFSITVATTGLSAKKLQQLGNIPFETSVTHGSSHASYYPNAGSLSITLTFCPSTGKIYGGQCVGYDGVDKRIDQIALIIKQKGTIYDLMELEHAYAPPFSSAKDPLAIAGYVASNVINGTMPVIQWNELKNKDLSNGILLDTRTPEEFSFGTIDQAINIPIDELRQRMHELDKNKPIYVFCAVGLRGYLATRILLSHGFSMVKNLSGGYRTYSTATAPVINKNEEKKQDFQNITNSSIDTNKPSKTIYVDACGLQCPGPIMKIKQHIDLIEEGEQIEITATDEGFARDAQAWCNSTGNILVKREEENGKHKVVIKKGGTKNIEINSASAKKGKSLILFSDDLDKVLATFVLANGAAATGEKTTIFFTFWGLNALKKEVKPKVKKDIWGRMFDMMLPSNSLELRLSKMNMFGLGSFMMRHIMKKKGINSLEELRQQAINNGVEFIACQMSMDVMGIKKEELIDEASVGGVATYMERAEKASVNLFI